MPNLHPSECPKVRHATCEDPGCLDARFTDEWLPRLQAKMVDLGVEYNDFDPEFYTDAFEAGWSPEQTATVCHEWEDEG